MKKIITTILAATLILSTTACGQNTEIEALKEENEQLRAQLEDSNKPTETPTETLLPPNLFSDKYDQIQYGMSYSQVVEILGQKVLFLVQSLTLCRIIVTTMYGNLILIRIHTTS